MRVKVIAHLAALLLMLGGCASAPHDFGGPYVGGSAGGGMSGGTPSNPPIP